MAKIVALLIYIALGFVALRLGRTYRTRVAAFTAALACFAYIGLVAVKGLPGRSEPQRLPMSSSDRYLRRFRVSRGPRDRR